MSVSNLISDLITSEGNKMEDKIRGIDLMLNDVRMLQEMAGRATQGPWHFQHTDSTIVENGGLVVARDVTKRNGDAIARLHEMADMLGYMADYIEEFHRWAHQWCDQRCTRTRHVDGCPVAGMKLET